MRMTKIAKMLIPGFSDDHIMDLQYSGGQAYHINIQWLYNNPGSGIIYYKIQETGLLPYVISAIAGILIVLLCILILEEENVFAYPITL